MRIVYLTNEISSFGTGIFQYLVNQEPNSKLIVFLSTANTGPKSKIAFLLKIMRQQGLKVVTHTLKRLVVFKIRLISQKLFHNKVSTYDSVLELPLEKSMKVYKTVNINSPDELKKIRQFRPHLIISVGFNQILTDKLLKLAHLAAINVHPSLLPQYKGLRPCFWVLYYREKRTGVSVHLTTNKIDGGRVIHQVSFPIIASDTEKSLLEKATQFGGPALVKTINKIRSKKFESTKQAGKGSYFGNPNKEQIKELAKNIMTSNKLFMKRIDCFRPYIRGKRVLDLGCVGGDFRLEKPIISSLHKEIVKEAKTTVGIDLNKRGIKLMKKENPQLDLLCADVYNMPLVKQSFDVVVVGDLIEHLDNVGVFLKEVKRVLKPDGILLGSVPNAYNFSGFLRLFFRSQPTPSRNSTHVYLFDNRTLYLLLLQNELKSEIFFRTSSNIFLRTITYFYPMFSPAIIFVASKISSAETSRLLNTFYQSIVL